jgi:hypothetical protein
MVAIVGTESGTLVIEPCPISAPSVWIVMMLLGAMVSQLEICVPAALTVFGVKSVRPEPAKPTAKVSPAVPERKPRRES